MAEIKTVPHVALFHPFAEQLVSDRVTRLAWVGRSPVRSINTSIRHRHAHLLQGIILHDLTYRTSGDRPGIDIHPWVTEFPGAIAVCHRIGIIVDMNDNASEAFAGIGGCRLIGKEIFDCYPEPSKSRVKVLLECRRQNIYCIFSGAKEKLVFQTPLFVRGEFSRYSDVMLEIPREMSHFESD